MTIPIPAMAVPRIPKALQRIQVGYSFIMTTATYTERAFIFDDFAQRNIDTTFSKHVKTKGGFGATVGTYFPIVKMSDKSSLNIDLDYLYNFMIWDARMVSLDGYNSSTGEYTYNTNDDINAVTLQMALPVGISFKTGGEATMDRSQRLSLTLGTGIYPSANFTVFENYAGSSLKIQPYLKAEVGFFAGINWKIRALYSFGNLEYVGYNSDLAGSTYAYESDASLKSKATFSVSLMVCPLSFAWGKSEWWR